MYIKSTIKIIIILFFLIIISTSAKAASIDDFKESENIIHKRINSAISNTKNKEIPIDSLIVKDIQLEIEPEKKIMTRDEILNEAVTMIKQFEGFRAKAYWDHKHYSIGYGLNAKGRSSITELQASNEVKWLAGSILDQMENKYGLKDIDPEIKVSLISFFYNLGWRDEVIKVAKTNDKEKIANTIKYYRKASNRILKGLVARRSAEIKYFTTYKNPIKY